MCCVGTYGVVSVPTLLGGEIVLKARADRDTAVADQNAATRIVMCHGFPTFDEGVAGIGEGLTQKEMCAHGRQG